jgi:glycosyltransferase involved in cell wall biosynthesis
MPDSHSKIKIAYVIDNYYPGGGSENQLITLIDHLDRSRFEPYVFNLRPRWPQMTYPSHCPIAFLDILSLWSVNGYRALRRLAQFLRDESIDIVQVYFMESRILGTLAARRAGMARIVFCRRDMGMSRNWLRRRLAARSDYCIVNADRVREFVIETERFPAERIETIYNGVRLKQPVGERMTRESLKIPEQVPIVGLIGNYRPVKRIDRFLRVAAAVRDERAHYLAVGHGPLRTELQAQAEALGIAERCRFFRTIDGIPDVLDMLTVGVSTSESEGLSNVLIEYALAGKPAVAFDVGGNSEIIRHEQTGYIVPVADESAMVARIEHLLANPAARLEMGAEARRYSMERFDVESMVHRTEAFYERIVANRTGR